MTFPALFPTAQRIVILAYEDAKLTSEGQTPNSEQIARGMSRLNDIINFWNTSPNLHLWTMIDQSINLVADQQSYTIMSSGDVNLAKPMRILQGYIEIADTDETKRPITAMSWDEWMRISQTGQTGTISQFFVDKLYDRLTVYFWLIPDSTEAANTAHLLIQQRVTNFQSLTETMMFPQEWFIALRWALAYDLSTGQPETVVNRCLMNMNMYKAALESWDVEDPPTQFTPDPRMGLYTGQFR